MQQCIILAQVRYVASSARSKLCYETFLHGAERWYVKYAHSNSVRTYRNRTFITSAYRTSQSHNQEFALGGRRGGLFWILEKTSNNLDPDLNRSLIRLSRDSRPKWSDLQKKKKNNFRWGPTKELQLSRPNQSKSFTTSDCQYHWGGGYFHFRSKNRPQKH